MVYGDHPTVNLPVLIGLIEPDQSTRRNGKEVKDIGGHLRLRMKGPSLRLTSVSDQKPKAFKMQREIQRAQSIIHSFTHESRKKRKKSRSKIKVEDQQNLVVIKFLSMHRVPLTEIPASTIFGCRAGKTNA